MNVLALQAFIRLLDMSLLIGAFSISELPFAFKDNNIFMTRDIGLSPPLYPND